MMKNICISVIIGLILVAIVGILRNNPNQSNVTPAEISAEENSDVVEYDVILSDIECCVEFVMLDTNLTSKRYDRESGSIHDTSTYLVDFVDKDGNKYTQDFTGEIMFGEGDTVSVDIGLILDENDNIISYDINNVRLKENHSSI